MYTFDNWKDEGHPGYLGAKRDEIRCGWDEKYGKGKWTLGWQLTRGVYTDFLGACALYEDAYMHFMADRPDLVDDLVTRASNVYDVGPSDIDSGLDYNAQLHSRTHVQDISIRRVLTRMGRWFCGPSLIQIRFHIQLSGQAKIDPLSPILMPGRVPFHLPAMLEAPLTNIPDRWYDPDSVEAFYQFNKHLLVRK